MGCEVEGEACDEAGSDEVVLGGEVVDLGEASLGVSVHGQRMSAVVFLAGPVVVFVYLCRSRTYLLCAAEHRDGIY